MRYRILFLALACTGIMYCGCAKKNVARNNIMLADVVDAAQKITGDCEYKNTEFHRLFSQLLQVQGLLVENIFMYDNFNAAKIKYIERGLEFYVVVWLTGSHGDPMPYDCNAILLFDSDARILDHIAFGSLGKCKVAVDLLPEREADGTDIRIQLNDKKKCIDRVTFLYDNFKYEDIDKILAFQKLSVTPDGFQLPLRGFR